MSEPVDMTKFIASTVDQLTAEDLIGGPLTIKITSIRGTEGAEQPVAIGYEGDDGKPFRPSKTVRRVMVHAWGPDGKSYVGRSLTLYRDENVTYGGRKVGGLRISHMSHIDREMTVVLAATRGKKSSHTVKPLKTTPDQPSPERVAQQHDQAPVEEVATSDKVWAEAFRANLIKNAKTADEMMSLWSGAFDEHLAPMRDADPELFASVETWFGGRLKRFREQEAGA